MTQESTVENQEKSLEDLKAELAAAVTKYENLNRAHDKLKDDLKEFKTKSSATDELQKQLDALNAEKETLASEFETYKSGVKQDKAKQLLTDKLTEAGAKSLPTAMKLIDMEAIKFDDKGEVDVTSIEGAINALKTEHEIIFAAATEPTNKPSAPAVKHAVDTVTKSAYETEMAAAVKSGSQAKLDEVFAKYQGTKL